MGIVFAAGLKLLSPGQIVHCVLAESASCEPNRLVVSSVGSAQSPPPSSDAAESPPQATESAPGGEEDEQGNEEAIPHGLLP